jgi:arylsulfatase A-like enzyme
VSAGLQTSESQCGRAIRTEQWKYSVCSPDKSPDDPSSAVYVEEFLYDLKSDPHERRNLVSDPALGDIREQLKRRLIRRMVQAGESEPRILSHNKRKVEND